MMTYVEGYKLAVEDVLADIDLMAKDTTVPASWRAAYGSVIREMRMRLTATMASTNRTYQDLNQQRKRNEEIAMEFICVGCRSGEHASCSGGTWCDCQHRAPKE